MYKIGNENGIESEVESEIEFVNGFDLQLCYEAHLMGEYRRSSGLNKYLLCLLLCLLCFDGCTESSLND